MDEALPIRGHYNTLKAETPTIILRKCDSTKRSTCKSDQEINEWLNGKFIFTIENNWKFNATSYDPEYRLEKQSKFRWFSLNSNAVEEQFLMFSAKEMSFQDGYL